MKHKKTFIAYSFLILLSSIFIFMFGVRLNQKVFEYKKAAEKGTLNLVGENLHTLEYIILRGEWEFYWNQLYAPTDFLSNDNIKPCYINLPGIWNNFNCDTAQTTPKGYATYRLNILLDEPGYYGLRIKEFDCAYKLWVNGKDSVGSGKVGRSIETEIPDWRRNELFFYTDSPQVEIILQISNFNHRKGGAEDPIVFGKGKKIYDYKLIQVGVAYFLLGFFVIMILQHLVLFIYRRSDISSILFAIFNLLNAVRLGTTGEKVLLDIFPNMPWGLAIRLEYLSYTIAVPIIYAFFYSLFPKEFSKLGLKLISTIGAIVVIIVLVFPSEIFSFTPVYYQIAVAISAVYALIILTMAALKNKDNALIVLGGYAFFFMGTINDILYYNHTIESSFLMPFGLFVMIFSQAFVLSKNNAQIYQSSKALSLQLEDYSRTLEQRVEDRTKDIEIQKNEIEKKSAALLETNQKLNKLNKFTKDMTSMIVHDLKNPLSAIINIDKISDERKQTSLVKYSGYTMLNLVQNILDVYKHEHASMDLNLTKVNMFALIEKALHEVEFFMQQKSIVSKIAKGFNFELPADESVLRRVFVNLLSNAIKYSPKNDEITIILSINDENYLRVGVINNGPGIAKDKQKIIFDHFGQVEKRNTMNVGSTGLGLTFCKMAIEAHGGNIGVYSELNSPVEFWFTLPFAVRLCLEDFPAWKNKSNLSKLNKDDKDYLKPYAEKLKGIKIFEVSKINQILKDIKPDRNSVQDWQLAIEEALYKGDEGIYMKLLDF